MAFKIIVGDDSVLEQRETREPGPGRSAIIGHESNMRGNERWPLPRLKTARVSRRKAGPEGLAQSRYRSVACPGVGLVRVVGRQRITRGTGCQVRSFPPRFLDRCIYSRL